MATVTAEDIECRDILNDVGICFMDDMDALEASLTRDIGDFERSESPFTTKFTPMITPVSPDPTSQMLPPNTFEPLNLLSGRSTEQFALPSMQPLMPNPLASRQVPEFQTSNGNSRCLNLSKQNEAHIVPASASPKGRKRKYDGTDTEESSDEQEEVDRRKRNREHAKRSRYRKKILTNNLLQAAEELREQTDKLREELYDAIGEDKVHEILDARKREEQDKFVNDLKEPSNRVVDGSTRKFLLSLRKKLPKR
eukprot:scaffold504_cov109-Cylindrotheca_fusiformis.AAC.4